MSSLTPSRRQVLTTTALAAGAASMSPSLAGISMDSVKQDLERYVGFGVKASGGPGDIACGEWLESELHKRGFTVQRQTISVPFFTPSRAELTTGSQTAPV
ncbi:MAG TPA: hypothetical protein VL971_09880, partial [Rhizomicrobium sp.]|nr:hypothetical protein [Rhizomicrobium sp.]